MPSIWPTLLAAALLGTDRRAPTWPAFEGPLGERLARLDRTDPERALLQAAGLVGLYRRAGRQLPLIPAFSGPVSPPDPWPVCSLRASQHLQFILSGSMGEVLPEWLAELIRHQQRVPEEYVPAVLTWGVEHPEYQARVGPAIGQRGRWLAAQQASWAYAGETPLDEARWQTGTPAERAAYLTALRQADPARARTRLVETWNQENPDDRVRWLALLQINVSLADEPFLESVLSDRRKEVRRAAAGVLARLPGSALVARIRARLDLQWTRSGGLMVSPPEACDRTLQRDGVEPKPRKNTGEKAWWLTQMLGAIPPALWTAEFGVAPATLIAAAAQSEWSQAVLEGWLTATVQTQDADWTLALARAWMHDPALRLALTQPDLQPALEALPTADFEALLHEALRSTPDPVYDSHPVLWLLRRSSQAWTPEWTRAWVASVRRRLTANAQYGQPFWAVRSLLKQFAHQVPPEMWDELSQGWPRETREFGPWEKDVDEFLEIVKFRRDIRAELQAGHPVSP